MPITDETEMMVPEQVEDEWFRARRWNQCHLRADDAFIAYAFPTFYGSMNTFSAKLVKLTKL
jgi:hypothetical protein